MIDKLGITPGPWDFRIIRGQYDSEYAMNIPTDDIHQNVLEAAPEMLEACIRLMDAFHNQENHQTLFLAVAEASTAVEKATGKTWEEIRGLI